jgi:hypothetical protein
LVVSPHSQRACTTGTCTSTKKKLIMHWSMVRAGPGAGRAVVCIFAETFIPTTTDVVEEVRRKSIHVEALPISPRDEARKLSTPLDRVDVRLNAALIVRVINAASTRLGIDLNEVLSFVRFDFEDLVNWPNDEVDPV